MGTDAKPRTNRHDVRIALIKAIRTVVVAVITGVTGTQTAIALADFTWPW